MNRTDSAHSNNVRSASNTIPCFPANNSTDVHHCDIVSSRSSPSHFTKDTPFNTSQVRTRSTKTKLNHCLENQKGHYLRNRNTGECSCCSSSQHDLISFWNLFIYVNNSQYNFYITAFPPMTVLMCITVTLYQVVPRHIILQRILLLILPKSEPGQLQKN